MTQNLQLLSTKRKRKRPTMHQVIFYRLWKNREAGNAFVPIYQLMGEVHIPELDVWGFVSYEISARMSELFSGNPGLFARERITGRSGAKYYQYRIHSQATAEKILDPDLREFYERVKKARERM